MFTKNLTLAVAVLFLFTVGAFVTSSTARDSTEPSLAQASETLNVDLDVAVEALVIGPITLKEGVEPEAFEKFVKEYPSFEGLIPGVKLLIMKGDRGLNKGKYIYLIDYDSVSTRNFYFPEDGGETETEASMEAWLKASGGLLEQWMQKSRQYIQPLEPPRHTDYVAIKSMMDIQQGAITGHGPMGAVGAFSFRPMTLKEGVEPDAFEKFVKEGSSLEGLIPGAKILFMKGDRGINKGKYINLWVYDSVNTRNFHFPTETTGLWNVWLKAFDRVTPQQMPKLSEYVQPTDPSTRGDYTDYVAIKPMQKRKLIYTTSAEENKAIVRRCIEELNKANWATFIELHAPDFVYRGPGSPKPLTREELVQSARMVYAAFPDRRYTIDDMIAEGDKVVNRMTLLGTHKGEFQGIPATGKEGTLTSIIIFRIARGKIVEGREEYDMMSVMQQLGAIPPIEEAGKK